MSVIQGDMFYLDFCGWMGVGACEGVCAFENMCVCACVKVCVCVCVRHVKFLCSTLPKTIMLVDSSRARQHPHDFSARGKNRLSYEK